MSKEEQIEEIKNAILDIDPDALTGAAREYVDDGHDGVDAISNGITPAMEELGDLFDKGQVFLPQLMTIGDGVQDAVEILMENIEGEQEEKDLVVIGTVEGDVHDIGKNIVALLLKVQGFDVIDLGRDVPLEEFIEATEENGPAIVGSSALMTTTRPNMEEIEKMLKDAGLRDKVKTMVGGAPVTKKYAEKIGADAYAEDAKEAVETAQEIVAK
ncbi:B12-binding domain-containing protein [Methanonatronarchaeum sp. AMET6-2]|uniref:cobalamin B12-binding domain-containing protein n=1 Tax=Methanonatronarchaeum sp. AMET6-2 TaxID=2933293 RepID=UPI00122A8FAD|nr:corrinoid protein [Methanonatronarchaeum sp. AMET6-2]RZN63219.1 MAG: dimethylamine corrinoid protein 3 [Methanonatronarchaeia archaeon]UOY10521.1 corrinoid protein [Methanonatronarchaeum sp. AMET6-2]